MLESPVLPCLPPGQTASIKEAPKLLSPATARLLPSFATSPHGFRSYCGNRGDGKPSVPAIDSRRPASGPVPSIRINDPGSGRVPAVDSRHRAPRPLIRVDDPGSGRVSAVDSRALAPRPRPCIRVDDPGSRSSRVSAIDSRRPAPSPRPVDDPGSDRRPLRAIDSRRLAARPLPSTCVDDAGSGRARSIDSCPPTPRPRPSIRVDDPVSGRVSAIDLRRSEPPLRPIDDPGSGHLPLPAIDSRRPAPRLRSSIRAGDLGSGHDRISLPAIDSRRPAPRLRSSIRVGDPGSGHDRIRPRRPAPRPSFGVSGSCKPSAAANKELEEANNEIQRLNELRLGDDISYEEFRGFVEQLPDKPDVDTSTKLGAVQLKELNTRHALYRMKYSQLSRQVPEDKLGYDKLKEDLPPSILEEKRLFKPYKEDGKLDWSFHPDYCKLAGLEDYQRIVPRNYGGYEYVSWDDYHKDFHSYEIEQEYINYCEELSKKLKWMEVYVPNKSPSLKWGRILTRGTYQAIKIATGFSKITGGLAFSGFYEWLDSMTFDVCCCNELDGVYYEIWQRYTSEKKFRDALDEVHKLNRFPLRQHRMRCALENDIFCSDLEEEFLACTTCLKEFAEDKAQITEEKARNLIAEALRKEMQKPKFYEEYCRKKIDIARAIGLISS